MESKEWHEVVLILLFIVFFAINLLDYVSTVVGLARGLVELNWLAVILMQRIGEVLALLIIKVAFTALIGFTIWAVLKKTPFSFLDDDMLIIGLLLLNVFGALVLSNNFSYIGWFFPFTYHF